MMGTTMWTSCGRAGVSPVHNMELSTDALVTGSRGVDDCGRVRARRNFGHAGETIGRPQSTGLITDISSRDHRTMTTSTGMKSTRGNES